jgi:phosphate-selective porin OprO/OprP
MKSRWVFTFCFLSAVSLSGTLRAQQAATSWDTASDTVQQTAAYRYGPFAPADEEAKAEDDEEAEEDLPLEERLDSLVEESKGYGESIEELDKSLTKLGETVKKITDDKSFVHSGGSKNTMKLTGRIHIDHWAFPTAQGGIPAIEGGDPQDRLLFRRLRFGVAGKLVGNMEYKIEMEFAGANQTEFRDAYLGWNELPFFNTLLIGNQKRPYGLDHINSSRYNVFLERPFIIEAFNQDSRRLGIASYGYSDDLKWNWRYGVYNQQLIQNDGIYIGDNLQMELTGRLANTIWYDEVSGGRGYAHWAVAHSWASPNGNGNPTNEARFRHRPEARSTNRWIDTGTIAGTDDYHLLGLEGVVNVGPLQVVGEFQNVWLSRDPGAGPDLSFNGAYVYAAYFLTGEHMPWERESGQLGRIKPFEDFFLVDKCDGCIGSGLGAWQIAARYSYGDLIDGDIAGGLGKAMTLGLNWYWTPTARLQFNWSHGSITNNAGRTGDYDILGTRFMVDF